MCETWPYAPDPFSYRFFPVDSAHLRGQVGKSPGAPHMASRSSIWSQRAGGMQMADACLGELGVPARADRVTRRLGREAPAEHELDMGIGL